MDAFDADVIVVGSGAGGATLAYACARAGKKVLLLERGNPPPPITDVHDEQAMLIDKKPYDDREVNVNGVPRRLYMGGVPGGGTALYGAALLRPSPHDFHPGASYGDRLPRSQWDWPIDHEVLEPYYREAELLFQVAGGGDNFGPLPRPTAYPWQPLPLHPVNEQLMAASQRRGLKPFRLPLAIDPTRCLRCNACPGYVCPTGARRSSAQLLNEAGESLRVLCGMDVETITWASGGHAAGVTAVERATGRRHTYRGRRYVLAAGGHRFAASSPGSWNGTLPLSRSSAAFASISAMKRWRRASPMS